MKVAVIVVVGAVGWVILINETRIWTLFRFHFIFGVGINFCIRLIQLIWDVLTGKLDIARIFSSIKVFKRRHLVKLFGCFKAGRFSIRLLNFRWRFRWSTSRLFTNLHINIFNSCYRLCLFLSLRLVVFQLTSKIKRSFIGLTVLTMCISLVISWEVKQSSRVRLKQCSFLSRKVTFRLFFVL